MKTIIAIPCMDSMDTVFVKSLLQLGSDKTAIRHILHSGSLVYDSRNKLTSQCLELGADFVLWLDSDVVFPPSLLDDLIDDMDGRDMVTGIYYMRRPPFKPTIFKTVKVGQSPDEATSEIYTDYPTDGPFEIDACGFGAVLMRTKVLADVANKYHDAFGPIPGCGEDISFCLRARACGYKIYADPRLQVGHRAETVVTHQTYLAFNAQNPGGDPNGKRTRSPAESKRAAAE